MTPKDNELRMQVALVVTHTDDELLFVRSEKYANTLDALQAFADLVRQDEREQSSLDYLEDCYSAIDYAVREEREACAKQYLRMMRDAINKATLRERESCAKLCEKLNDNQTNQSLLEPSDCAEAIRARSNHDTSKN